MGSHVKSSAKSARCAPLNARCDPPLTDNLFHTSTNHSSPSTRSGALEGRTSRSTVSSYSLFPKVCMPATTSEASGHSTSGYFAMRS